MWTNSHLGSSFEVWAGTHGWFWFVADVCEGAAIGAAPNQMEAISDARLSIQEMQRYCRSVATPKKGQTRVRSKHRTGRGDR
jgi:hypothetical protein